MSGAPVAVHGGPKRLLGQGYPRSLTIGSAFAVAWTPCIGPILGVVLTLAATSGSWVQGAVLLAFYSAGLGVWFLAFGVAFGWVQPKMRSLNPHLPKVMAATGAVFIVVGALMFLGEFTRLNNYFQSFGFFFERTAEAEASLATGAEGWLGPGIAFLGGMASFLSPCVLPLVPAYLVNLAGETVLGGPDTRAARMRIIGHAAAFVIGFAVIFTLIGASAGFAGTLITQHLDTLTRIAGVVLMVFGMQIAGLIHIPYLERTYQVNVR
jgi:cytochrome c biogenesis protein CcdA